MSAAKRTNLLPMIFHGFQITPLTNRLPTVLAVGRRMMNDAVFVAIIAEEQVGYAKGTLCDAKQRSWVNHFFALNRHFPDGRSILPSSGEPIGDPAALATVMAPGCRPRRV